MRPALLIVAILAQSLAARAQDAASDAQLERDLGAAIYARGRPGEALGHYLESYRLVPRANVALNVARIYSELSRAADAYNWYERYLTEFSLDDDQRRSAETLRDALLAQVAVIDVGCEPHGAALFVDRDDTGSVGNGPRRVAVAAGEHTIIAEREGFRPARATVTGVLGRITPIALTLEAILGTLAVASEPTGAEVLLEGQEQPLGVTPLAVDLPVGATRVLVRHEGYTELARTVTIAEGQTATLRATLERLALRVAVLSVVAAPAGATVSIDGAQIGTAPMTIDTVAPGVHRIEVARAGLSPWSDEIVLEAGGGTRIDATLEDPNAIHFEMLRFIGYGVGGAAVLAGVGTGIGAILSRDAFFTAEDAMYAQIETTTALNITTDVLLVTGIAILAATLIADLVIGPRPRSRARVEADR